MVGLTSDNLRPITRNSAITNEEFKAGLKTIADEFRLQAARFSMHKVRLYHYQLMVRNGIMSPDLAKQYYLAAMNNYDDMMKSATSGSFSDAIEREMEDFDINEAFSA